MANFITTKDNVTKTESLVRQSEGTFFAGFVPFWHLIDNQTCNFKMLVLSDILKLQPKVLVDQFKPSHIFCLGLIKVSPRQLRHIRIKPTTSCQWEHVQMTSLGRLCGKNHIFVCHMFVKHTFVKQSILHTFTSLDSSFPSAL